LKNTCKAEGKVEEEEEKEKEWNERGGRGRYLVRDKIFNKGWNNIYGNVNKNPTDATVCRYLFTAKSLYMFWVSQHPSSGVLKNCNRSLRYRS